MDGFVNDPFVNMPLELMMLVEVRCAALKKYRALSDEDRKRADAIAGGMSDRMEKERFIDAIERGEFV